MDLALLPKNSLVLFSILTCVMDEGEKGVFLSLSACTFGINQNFYVYSFQFIQHVARLFIKTSTCQCAGNECMHGLASAQHAHRLLIQTSACNCTANRVHTQ
ncbi:hypothetical protein BpHYR1_003386 [Brachionus plicatilis]|uniref:Uncharacterized protein n=1 Tax=Brachionus plicatilis TaxID=10195 RepID=A0A3M7SY63_BRAPC|nr:hypothetical protein BpHYR1_003386 [Brachionus plicatilis]